MLAKLKEDRMISRNEKERDIKYETNSSNKKLITSHDMSEFQKCTKIIENRKEDCFYH